MVLPRCRSKVVPNSHQCSILCRRSTCHRKPKVNHDHSYKHIFQLNICDQLASKTSSLVSDECTDELDAKAAARWDCFYRRHAEKFFRDRWVAATAGACR